MEYNNRLNRSLAKLDRAPVFLRKQLLNYTIGRTVPMIGTAEIRFQEMSCERLVAIMPNKKKVQNHISQVHAAASVLLAESATGILFGMNIPDDKLPLMKNLSAKYIKRSKGQQTAIATLSPDQIGKIRSEEKGDVMIDVKIKDETGEEVVICEMNWAWVPKKKK